MLKCVPLDPDWTGSETKLDLKAIYRRRKQDNWGKPVLDAQGLEQWDTTGPLPLRRHNAWERKGFQYVTLADYASLEAVSAYLPDWRSFIQDPRTRSPFSFEKYQAGAMQRQIDALAGLRALVEKYGLEAVTDMKRADAPGWQMPSALVDEFAEDAADADAAPKRKPGRPKKEPVAA